MTMPSVPDAVILCGGAGTRLKNVTGDVPKPMAEVGHRPFLELLLRQLRRNGFSRAVLAVGYREVIIREHFGDRAFGLNIVYSSESVPLGTGGALRNCVGLVESEAAVILNGDSYSDADLMKFVRDFHESGADASILVVPGDGRSDCGFVTADSHGRVTRFVEKDALARAGYVNAGLYVVSHQLLSNIPPALPVSLEKELFPGWLAKGKYLKIFVYQGACVDIGTPERYARAQELLATAEID
jgi:mannose-1-phosphate guanylyltransferase